MHIFLFLAICLTVVVLAAKSSSRTGIAAPLLLLCVGIAASFPDWIPSIVLEPELVLAGFLPPLLFSSATNMNVVDLRRNMGIIVWLSGVTVVVPAVVIGLIIYWVFPEITIPLGIALGAVVAPIDAVAATSIGKRLGLPPRIMAVLEGESLFNDASALVTLRTALAAVAGSFSLIEAAGSFFWATVAGIVIGLVVGQLAIAGRRWVGDPVLGTTLALMTPWTAFFLAEELDASGVIAVVVAGIVCGHQATRKLPSADRSYSSMMWTIISFILEHLVFLLMGLQIADLMEFAERDHNLDFVWQASLLVLGLLIVFRFGGVAVAVMGTRITARKTRHRQAKIDHIAERFNEAVEQNLIEDMRAARMRRRLDRSAADIDFAMSTPITRRGALVLSWAGMRGVVTLAAAQTISFSGPDGPLAHRSSVILVAFYVAVASLILFGGTLPWLIRRLQFSSSGPDEKRHELQNLLNSVIDEAVEDLGPLSEQKIDGEALPARLTAKVERRMEIMVRGPGVRTEEFGSIEREQLRQLQVRYLEAMQEALNHERAIGAYSAKTFNAAQKRLDMFEEGLGSAGNNPH